jgi:hypothetical protein
MADVTLVAPIDTTPPAVIVASPESAAQIGLAALCPIAICACVQSTEANPAPAGPSPTANALAVTVPEFCAIAEPAKKKAAEATAKALMIFMMLYRIS